MIPMIHLQLKIAVASRYSQNGAGRCGTIWGFERTRWLMGIEKSNVFLQLFKVGENR